MIFGNPQGDTLLMQCDQTIGIDLPPEALVWQAPRSALLLCNDSDSIFARHLGRGEAAPAVTKLGSLLAMLAGEGEGGVRRGVESFASPATTGLFQCIKCALQQPARGHLVHQFGTPLTGSICCEQSASDGGRGKAFVPQQDR